MSAFHKTLYLLLSVVLGVSVQAAAAELEIGHVYRLGITIPDLKSMGDATTTVTACQYSKFTVLESSVSASTGTTKDHSKYLVQFTKNHECNLASSTTITVTTDKVYELPKQFANGLSLSSVASESLTGLSSGPLVVPFKYRLDDKSLSGEAEIGFYAGVTLEAGCTKAGWCFRITPLISAGLSQISAANGTQTESKSGVSLATGLLITNWSNLNIGIIYGQDRIGDAAWPHEGKGWLSFMVGWQL